jgi:hypothetical protein
MRSKMKGRMLKRRKIWRRWRRRMRMRSRIRMSMMAKNLGRLARDGW